MDDTLKLRTLLRSALMTTSLPLVAGNPYPRVGVYTFKWHASPVIGGGVTQIDEVDTLSSAK
jgi:hypothetical protein